MNLSIIRENEGTIVKYKSLNDKNDRYQVIYINSETGESGVFIGDRDTCDKKMAEYGIVMNKGKDRNDNPEAFAIRECD